MTAEEKIQAIKDEFSAFDQLVEDKGWFDDDLTMDDLQNVLTNIRNIIQEG